MQCYDCLRFHKEKGSDYLYFLFSASNIMWALCFQFELIQSPHLPLTTDEPPIIYTF